jgi:hypothetical protein
MRADLVDAVRYPVEPMTTVISPWRCRRNDVRAIRLERVVNAPACAGSHRQRQVLGRRSRVGESITSTDRQECGVRPVVVALRRMLGRTARDDVARDVASSGLQLPRAVSCWLRRVPPSE